MESFERYGKLADEKDIPDSNQNGRYALQSEAENLIPCDLISKLKPDPKDVFLDVGCGTGLNLLAFASRVKSATACDHVNVLKKLRAKNPGLQCKYLPGNFLDVAMPERYTAILVYSVVQSFPNLKTVYALIDKALGCLAPGGRILLGDLPNADKKSRFLETKVGAAFEKNWALEQSKNHHNDKGWQILYSAGETFVKLGDSEILGFVAYIRERGYHAHILNQHHGLPFGATREDILITCPTYFGNSFSKEFA